MKNLSIKAKLLAIVISSIVIVSIAILIESNIALYSSSQQITEKFEKESYSSKEAELKNYVEVAVNTVESFYKRAQANPENAEQIKKEALATIQDMKYGKDGYYWVNDSNHVVVMHGAKPSLAGRDMTDLKDPKGTYVYKEIVKAANANSEGGLVKYMWAKPGYDEPQPKFSYVIRFPQWDWIVGTGAYVDNIDVKIQAMKDDTEANIYDTMYKNILIILVIMVILAYVMLLISKKTIFQPLENFQEGLLGFFKYLNKEQNNVEFLDEDGKDEIATMSKEVNQNIQKTKTLIEQDAELINDVKRVVQEVKNGYLNKKIEKTTQNEGLQELQIIFNEMLAIMEKNVHDDINELTNVLHKFKARDFRERIANPKGDVAVTLNELAEIINKTLLDNLTNGSTLNENAEILRGNVEQLSVSSNQQAASLEETAAALEEITSTITNTSENIAEMGTYTNELNSSINQGQDLASQTTASMEEINEQTELIADAITVIDQIAFQTNILSLNAAVEAATAGEAGKGFAVVAQEVRNLASRSAEAAKEIKDIVENATSKANSGKEISARMIQGYEEIAQKVQQTNEIITSITTASKEQTAGIAQINDAVAELDKATQENANVASNTSSIANETSKMAIAIVDEANESEFLNKESIAVKKVRAVEPKAVQPSYTAPKISTPKPSAAPSRTVVAPAPKAQVIAPSNDNDDEWESF